jgi:hypothetical protein
MQHYFTICFSIKAKYADIRNRSDVVGHGIMMKNHVKAVVEIYKKTRTNSIAIQQSGSWLENFAMTTIGAG